MAKPERKASTLQSGGLFPQKAAPEQPAAAPAPEQPAKAPKPAKAAPTEKAAKPAKAAPAPAETTNDETRSSKVAYYVTRAEGDRIRAAFMAGRNQFGWRSFSDFQHATVMAKVEELEELLNDGMPFEGVAPGLASRGRPFGS